MTLSLPLPHTSTPTSLRILQNKIGLKRILPTWNGFERVWSSVLGVRGKKNMTWVGVEVCGEGRGVGYGVWGMGYGGGVGVRVGVGGWGTGYRAQGVRQG